MISQILYYFLGFLNLVLLAYVVLSWVQLGRQVSRSVPHIDSSNPLVRFIDDTASMILYPLRRMLAPYQRGVPLDISVILAFLIIAFLQRLALALPF